MPDLSSQELLDASIDALENLTWLLAEEDDLPASIDAPVADLAFEGHTRGHILVQMHPVLLAQVAAAMLGIDDIPPPRDQVDALGEVANVVAGRVVARLGRGIPEVTLRPPRITGSWSEAVATIYPPPLVQGLQVGGMPVQVGLATARHEMRPEGLEPPTF